MGMSQTTPNCCGPEIGLSRIKERATDLPDRMEEENIGFYHKIREGYLMLAKEMPERFVVIDGTQQAKQLEEQIWNELSERFT